MLIEEGGEADPAEMIGSVGASCINVPTISKEQNDSSACNIYSCFVNIQRDLFVRIKRISATLMKNVLQIC